VGKRSRQRGRAQELRAPTTAYEHAEYGVLELRGAMSAGTRRSYAELPASTREDRKSVV